MPKNKGGRNHRKAKKGGNDINTRELMLKDDGQEYAQTLKMLGSGRCQGKCFDGKTRLLHIRGKMRKKIWIKQDDIVLIGLRDYQDDKADIIYKYSAEEARKLKSGGHLPDWTIVGEKDEEAEALDEECAFDFDDI